MARFLFVISRIIVGAVFVFSGFVKAVDPVGSAIKFSDYLGSFGMEAVIGVAMPAAFVISALEFLTGLHLLIGIRIKTSSTLALLFMVIFLPLTLGIAIFNPVTDCGCFGDAVKLSNWQTFFKNIVVMLPVLYLFFNRNKFNDNISVFKKLVVTLIFTIGILTVSYYSLQHLPIIDFRPYKIGKNITEGMTIPEGAQQAEYETTFLMEKDGEQKTFTTENYPYTDSSWVFIDTHTEILQKGYEPPIHDFVLNDSEGNDQASRILNSDSPVILIISPQVGKGEWKNKAQLVQIKDQAAAQGIQTYFLTASADDAITKFEMDSGAGFEYLNADETMLKTVIRSNPGMVLLQKGTVVGKWHHNDIPKVKEFKNPVSYGLSQLLCTQNTLSVLALFFAGVLIVLLLMRKEK
ncbi:hypothetical protein SAMN06265379_101607 [Saccharicrinis carchari]|uniref:Methylamine utilisation protein MauE domain-containing protein n=1 Tax=Saccharicrinis carchari TaxID=1168039 RepID=A0A521B262_SACCC|nr:BT_3928 family protein [Saccharicrinis carchari]SMO41121.1 hypothetical protein SAMN06265379_101607 [Saccharicrinis carchari]